RSHRDVCTSDLLRDDYPEVQGIVGTYDHRMSLPDHAVSNFLQIPRGPAFGVRDNHRLVDEDRDTKRVEVSRADVEVTVDVLFHDRRRMVVATEELTGVGHPPVGFADPNDLTFLLQVPRDVAN